MAILKVIQDFGNWFWGIPILFLIGGGASASADVYLDKVREHFKQYALSASRETPIKVASLGNDAGIIGAAYVALRAAGK